MQEQEIGVVTHYFGKVSVGIVKLSAALKVGDTIHVKGAHDDFTQQIASMQIDHADVYVHEERFVGIEFHCASLALFPLSSATSSQGCSKLPITSVFVGSDEF